MPSQPDFQLIEFERYGLLVANQSQAAAGDKSAKALQTWDLLTQDNGFSRGELLWRVALPLMAVLLMLLAIPLAFVNPRAGRSIGLLVALLLFVVYSNTISVFQAAVVQNRMSLLVGWWPVHILVLLLVVALFAWRLTVNSRYHPQVMWACVRRAMTLKRQG